jgi:hypothetical protein
MISSPVQSLTNSPAPTVAHPEAWPRSNLTTGYWKRRSAVHTKNSVNTPLPCNSVAGFFEGHFPAGAGETDCKYFHIAPSSVSVSPFM